MAQWKLSRRHPACVVCEHAFDEGEQHFSRIEVGIETIERADVCRACWPKDAQPDWIWWRARRAVARKKGLAVDWEILTQIFLALGPKLEALRASMRDGPFEAHAARQPAEKEPDTTVPDTTVPAALDDSPAGASDGSDPEAFEPDASAVSADAAVSGDAPDGVEAEPAVEPEPVLFQDPVERLEQVRYLLALLLLRKRRLMLVRAVRRNDGEALVVRRPRRKDTLEVRAFELDPERMDALRGELVRLFEGEGFDEVADDDSGRDSDDGPDDGLDESAGSGQEPGAVAEADQGVAPASEAAAKPSA